MTFETEIVRWGILKRSAFRFFFIYILLYMLPFPLDVLPKLDVAAEKYNQVWYRLIPWIGHHILHLPYEITDLPGGSGDTTFDYVQLLCFIVIAIGISFAWAILDRRRPSYPRLHNWFRTITRFYLGITMFRYGIAKVINTQFPFPDLDRYIQPVGHLSPMGLLWTFMGFSTPYCVFAGLAECIGGMLLFWRRTTTLGALIVVAVMANVVMLNFCYDVPVKQFSAHLLMLALFLLLPDIRNLLDFFILHRSIPARPLGRLFDGVWLNRAAAIAKLFFLGSAVGFSTHSQWESAMSEASTPKPPLYGLYEVESFKQNSSLESNANEFPRWRKIVVNRSNRLAIQFLDDSVERYFLKDLGDEGKIELTPRWEPGKKTTLSYDKNSDRLTLQGDFFGRSIQVGLRKVSNPHHLLVDRGFHWINEKPFNR